MFEDRPFGHHLKLCVQGASHAPHLAFELAGFPAHFPVDAEALAGFMARRAPGRDDLSTARRERDHVTFVAGVQDGRTNGGVIKGRIANEDHRPGDYGTGRTVPRPGHADFPQWVETGRIPTGGGENSGRLTAALCAAGGLCLQFLASRGIRVSAKVETIGARGDDFAETIRQAQAAGDSVGGTVVCSVAGLPPGLGGALFAGVETEMAGALFAIPGVKGVSFGEGFGASSLRGSQNNDPFEMQSGQVRTRGNRHGGILGGRTSGMPLVMRVAFKPTPTLFVPQQSVDLATSSPAVCEMKGRHDPCIVLRALPVVEAMAAFVCADILLAAEARVPRICLTLTGETLDACCAQYEAQRYFTDMVELRADCLTREARERVSDFPARVDVPVILTLRRTCDGGRCDEPPEARAAFFKNVLKSGCRFAYVDFEEDFNVPELTAAAQACGVRVIRSSHLFEGGVGDLAARCRALRQTPQDIPKIAFMPKDMEEVADFFRQAQVCDVAPRILCAMGAQGFVSRVLASRTRSFLTYASQGEALRTLGHVSPQTLVKTYRYRTLAPRTRLYAVTGYPLAFTQSPALNNAAFAAAAEPAVMFPFPARTADEALAFMRAFGLAGMAVTYPHKQAIMPLLDDLDKTVRAIGAVNTVVREGDRFVGYNTDAPGFMAALKAFLGEDTLAGRRVAVVGAGGAARAVVYALVEQEADVVVFNRTYAKAQALAAGFGCRAAPLGEASLALFAEYADIIVQCAAPNGDPARFDPLAFYAFTGREAVYDLVYEPALTPTLARAAAAGCRTENGLSMLEAQAHAQRLLYARALQG